MCFATTEEEEYVFAEILYVLQVERRKVKIENICLNYSPRAGDEVNIVMKKDDKRLRTKLIFWLLNLFYHRPEDYITLNVEIVGGEGK